uniref:Uncharacterized protein n=1 Tax=Bionectria ochroleuca TaxID=29856 RepID=A0A8H7TSZ2_BIOOC
MESGTTHAQSNADNRVGQNRNQRRARTRETTKALAQIVDRQSLQINEQRLQLEQLGARLDSLIKNVHILQQVLGQEKCSSRFLCSRMSATEITGLSQNLAPPTIPYGQIIDGNIGSDSFLDDENFFNILCTTCSSGNLSGIAPVASPATRTLE